MSLHLYNTLTRALEPFKPLRQDEVKVYYCGPTPYNYAHIGNLRNYLMDDFVVRILRFLGYRVKTVMNITDVEDKIIRDSREKGLSRKEFTDFYTEAFLTDCTKLRIIPADHIMPITAVIDEMGEIIDGLIQKGYAYLAEDGSIYYSVKKFKNYGKFAQLDLEGMISDVRVKNDEYDKEQVADFALWKGYDEACDGENKWSIAVTIDGEKRIVEGRPGWHIECSACNRHFFGDQIDIHMGGVDLIFPHHQNEIAQTEAFTGKQFSKYWMHGGHLLVDNKKMAKSAGNFYTLRDIVEKVSVGSLRKELDPQSGDGGLVSGKIETPIPPTYPSQGSISEALIYRGFRLMALQNQYRENFNFTFERLNAAINTIKGLDEMMKRLGRYLSSLKKELAATADGGVAATERNAHGKLKFHDISREFRDNQQVYMQDFIEKLENDFDTNTAMTIVFEYQSYINSGIDDDLFSLEEAKSLVDLLRSWDEVISVLDFSLLEERIEVPEEVTKLALDRFDAKLAKDWTRADAIRDELASMGWKMIDEPGGKWRVERV